MPLVEFLAELVVLPAVVVAYIALLFGVAQLLAPERLRRIGRGLRPFQLTIWQMMAVVAVAALVILAFLEGYATAFAVIVISHLLMAWFVRVWCHEFVFLMGLRDHDFPGRHDKLIWVLMLLVLAPLGPWVFRSYRLARWPEPAPADETQTQFHTEPPGRTTTAPQPA